MTDRPAIKPTALDALQAIADLPTGKNEDEMAGQEMAYRAVEALFPTPPIIHVNSCLLDKQEAVEGEAVAWLVTTVRTGEKRLQFQPVANLPYNRDRFISTPLYASPPVPAGYAVREALERISRLTPAAANASSARDLHATVKAIAETALSTPADTNAAQGVADKALRQIISDAASALPNGAFIHPEASVGFMEGLPKEIELVCSNLQSELARLRRELEEARRQDFEEAAGIADAHANQCRAKLNKKRSDHDLAIFESAMSEAVSIATVIRRRAEEGK